MDHHVEFRVLGSLEVVVDGKAIKLDAPKQRAVLAMLLVHANEAVSTDRLMDAVWGEEEVGIGTLRYHVSKLRENLQSEIGSAAEEIVVTEAPGYVLRIDPVFIDAARFDALVDEARQDLAPSPDVALRKLDEALGLWRGEAYAEYAYEEFAHLEAERLAEKRRGAIEDRMDALLALGRNTDAVAELEALAAEQPHRERLWGQLALALYRCGRQSDAVAALQRIRDELGDVGLDLSPPLKELEQKVFSQDPSLLDETAKPDQLRGYVLRGVVGEGAHAVVWRAAQPGIGREVALKAIRPELANQPEFVRRFEAEAQLVASLEHPNIISLYDFWRDPDGAYLVMPYLRGGNLAGVLRQGPLEPTQMLELVTAIGSALGHAHRRGVVHRDVTPHNVLLDEDGHPYLSDFGMAALLGGTGPSVTSSPAYMSPEESAGHRAVIQSDVFSLGVLVHAALSDRIPVAGEPLPPMSALRHDLPPAVDDVIACATAPDVANRYSSIAAFVDALARAIGIGRDKAPVLDIEELNPYKGLRAFEESDAADFFGREMLVSEVAQTVGRHRLVGVVGPSGCGKSSLVKAGVIPLLRRGVLPGSEQWLITDMYPGTRPLAELEAALLRVAVERPTQLTKALTGGVAELGEAFDTLHPNHSELFLVVDQLEELFTLAASEEERARFLGVLTELASNASLRVRVLVTLRADFYDRPLEYPEFGQLLRRGLVSVTMPTAEHLREAIAGPARRIGLGVDDALVESIVRDVSGQPGGLPLMEYALTELFERRHGPQLTIEAYRTTAGVMGALGRRAEDLYKRYDEAGRDAVRQTFLRLVTVEEGVADTRRRISLSELRELEIDHDALGQVLDDYGSHRLLTFDRDPDTREPTVEVAHEALLGRWDRLRTWIDDRRDDLATYRRLAAAAKEWTDSDGADEYLLTGGRLEHYQAFAAETDLFLTSTDSEYLAASRTYDSELASRRSRRRRAIMAGFGVAAMIASVFGVVAFVNQRRADDARADAEEQREVALQQKGEAEDAREDAVEQAAIADLAAKQARASELAAFAAQVLDEDPNLSLQLLLESIKTAEPTEEIITALHETMLQHRSVMQIPERFDHGGVLSPDGMLLFVFGWDSYAVIEVPTGKPIWEEPQNREEWITNAVFTTDGDAVFSLPENMEDESGLSAVVRIDVATSERTLFPVESEFELGNIVTNGAGLIDANRPLIVSNVQPPLAAVLRLDLASGTAETVATYDIGPVSKGLWTTDAAVTKLAFGFSERTVVLDLQSREILAFGPPATYGSNQLMSPDGTLVVTTDRIRNDVWSIERNEALWAIPGDPSGRGVFSLNGDRLLVGNRMFSVGGETLAEFSFPGSAESISADGQLGLSEDYVVNTGSNGEVGSVGLPLGGFYTLGVDLEGGTGVALRITESSAIGTAHVYDLLPGDDSARGEIRLEIPSVTGDPALSADGRLVALQQVEGQYAGQIGLYDTSSGNLVHELSGLCDAHIDTGSGPTCREYPDTPFGGFPHHMLLAPDGSLLVAVLGIGSELGPRALVVWDVASGDIVYKGPPASDYAWPTLSPSGDRLFVRVANGGEMSVTILDTATWERIGEIEPDWDEAGDVAGSWAVQFVPDGSLLTAGFSGLIRLEDQTWDLIARSDDGCCLMEPQLSPDGSIIATFHLGTPEIVLYDAATLTQLSRIVVGDPVVRGIKFVGDSELLVLGESGGIIVETDADKLIELAKNRVIGEFTWEECEAFGIDPCPVEPEPDEDEFEDSEGEPDEEEEPEN